MYLKIGLLSTAFFSLSLYGVTKKEIAKEVSGEAHYIEIKDKNQHDAINKKPGKHVIEYYAPWCGACQNMKPVYNEAAKTFSKRGINFYAVDVDNLKEVAKEKKIQAVPTITFVKNGKEVLRERGGISKAELTKNVNDLIANKLDLE